VVGVNSAGGYAGYFQGKAAVTGTLSIGGDTPMSHNPHMAFSAYLDFLFDPGVYVGGMFTPDQNIIVTRVQGVSVQNGGSGCVVLVNYVDNVTTVYYSLVFPGSNSYLADSGPISVPIPAGTQIFIDGQTSASGQPGCNTAGSGTLRNVNVNVQYVMQ